MCPYKQENQSAEMKDRKEAKDTQIWNQAVTDVIGNLGQRVRNGKDLFGDQEDSDGLWEIADRRKW